MNKHLLLVPLCAIVLSLVTVVPTFAAEPNTLTADELDDGWLLLFDGETLFGWHDNIRWKAKDGVLTTRDVSHLELTDDSRLLRTNAQWGNYVLKLDFRATADSKNNVLLRTPPRVSSFKHKSYAVAISGNSAVPTGSLIDRKHSTSGTDIKPGQWQTLEITADGAEISVKLDGSQMLDYTDPKPLGRGFIGLNFNSGPIEFRNIKLKPLGMKSIFNGKDLSGWKTYPELKSVCTVTEKGELNIKDGKGQIETVGRYGDFTLQLEVFVNGKELNSGIFFRCIPGDIMNGYESQIQNGFRGGNRKKPQDCGTGGIFRRQSARRVVANDFEWFRKTIHVDDTHMAVWVNGYQVSNWTDNRKPNENPRRGLRLAPGTIIIQGHDPTTDLSFRNLRISELPHR